MTKLTLSQLSLLSVIATITVQAREPVSFDRDIRQILTNHCYQCHGPDENHREAGLRLDNFSDATALREGAAAISPGKPGESLIIARIKNDDDDLRMPPPTLKKDLTDQQIRLLERWVSEGAEYEEHWAFTAPIRPQIPLADKAQWGNNHFDRFTYQKMRLHGLEPNQSADKEI